MSYRLVFEFEQVGIRPDLARSFREVFKQDFGFVTTVPVGVQFLKRDGTWTTVEAMFDTGASVSLFSKQVGEEIGIGNYVSHRLSGIARKEECMVLVKISRVRTRLIDSEGKVSPEFDLWVAFAEESVPHALGMKDIIQHFDFKTDLKAKKLYLEWK